MIVYVDVTDAVRTAWTAGIQRVVRQIVTRLLDDERVRVEPMVWSPHLGAFRHLTAAEMARLVEPSPPRPPVDEGSVGSPVAPALRRLWATTRRLLGRVRRAVVALLVRAGVKEPLHEAVRRVGRVTVHRGLVPLQIGPLPAGSTLLELDAVWNVVQVDRDALYGRLRARGVRVVGLLYDLLPQQHPEWFEPNVVELSDRCLTALARHADDLLAISDHTAASFLDWASARDLPQMEPAVVPLGALSADDLEPAPDSAGAGTAAVPAGRYLLVVGTVEPRKNHATALDAYEQLRELHPDLELVVAGRAGWRNEATLRRLERLVEHDAHVHWYRDVDDRRLVELYRGAFLVLVPSITEGFGLPVIEALTHGVPVVASNGGAIPEAGGSLVEYVPPADVAGWVAAVARHLEQPDHHADRRELVTTFRVPEWSSTVEVLIERLRALDPR